MNSDLSTRRQRSIVALLVAAAVFTAIAAFDLIAHPAEQGALRTYKEYILTATVIPAAFVVLWVLTALERLHVGYESRLGRVGLGIAAIGLVALVVDGVVTLAGGSTDAGGPLYPIAMLATLVGIVLMAIHWYRARVLPRWAGPTLALGWFLGATPILGSAFLILVAAFLAIAAGLRRQTEPRGSAPVGLDPSVAA